uniref:Uncharacterized protein n=1 Tax=Arundo donax TaxID=35708 RepID=A0A0A8Z1M7_ARUDO
MGWCLLKERSFSFVAPYCFQK